MRKQRPKREDGTTPPSDPVVGIEAPASFRVAVGGTLLLLLLVLVAHGASLRGEFVWDDHENILENRSVLDEDGAGLSRIWLVPGETMQYYPLTYTTFWLDFRRFGLDPIGYHVENLFLHAMAAILLWRLLVRLASPGALLAASLFAVHPVGVESVSWITERKNVLSAFFVFATVLVWAIGRERRSRALHAVAVFLFALALLSKSAIVVLPAILLLVVYWKDGRLAPRELLSITPFFLLAIPSAIVTSFVEHTFVRARGADWAFGPVERLLVASRAFWFHLGKLALPRGQCFIYPRWSVDAGSVGAWLLAASFLLLVPALWLARSRIGRGPSVAAAIYLLLLLPTLGFVDFFYMKYSFVQDHFQYLASVAPLALLAAGVARLPLRVSLLPAAAATLVLAILSYRHALLFRSEEGLWRKTCECNPESWMAANNLGLVLLRRERLDEAAQAFTESVRIDPNRGFSLYNLGLVEDRRGRLEPARALYRRALAVDPEIRNARLNLAIVLRRTGDLPSADRELRRILATTPEDVDARFHLAGVLRGQGRQDEAIEELRRLLAVEPEDLEARFELGGLLAERGRTEDALRELEAVAKGAPDHPGLHESLGQVLFEAGRYEEALAELGAALPTATDPARILYNLGLVRLKTGEVEAALESFREALRRDPGCADARRALALLGSGRSTGPRAGSGKSLRGPHP